MDRSPKNLLYRHTIGWLAIGSAAVVWCLAIFPVDAFSQQITGVPSRHADFRGFAARTLTVKRLPPPTIFQPYPSTTSFPQPSLGHLSGHSYRTDQIGPAHVNGVNVANLHPKNLGDRRVTLRDTQSSRTTIPSGPAKVMVAGTYAANASGTAGLRELQVMAKRADEHIRRGFELGRRGATFSARSEFIQALRLLANAQDAVKDGEVRSAALAAGLRALDEAEDFVPHGTLLEADLDLRAVVAAHRTPVYVDTPKHELLPLAPQDALQRYRMFAAENLAFAGGKIPAGSMALFGLGKVAVANVGTDLPRQRMHEQRAIAYLDAALRCDADNPLAANELGVLMARRGRLQIARDLFWRSAALHPQPDVWRNLAIVHSQLGENQLAQQAHANFQAAHNSDIRLENPTPAGAPPSVNLVDNATFFRSKSRQPTVLQPQTTNSTIPRTRAAPAKESNANPMFTGGRPWIHAQR